MLERPMTDEEREEAEMLIGAGREMATVWLKAAVHNSTDNVQMSNQLFVLRNAAIHVLTMCIYNEMTQLGHTQRESCEQVFGEILGELEMVVNDPDNVSKEFPEPGTEIQ
jgi:hypothetical protein